jgi:hypothetical protein
MTEPPLLSHVLALWRPVQDAEHGGQRDTPAGIVESAIRRRTATRGQRRRPSNRCWQILPENLTTNPAPGESRPKNRRPPCCS